MTDTLPDEDSSDILVDATSIRESTDFNKTIEKLNIVHTIADKIKHKSKIKKLVIINSAFLIACSSCFYFFPLTIDLIVSITLFLIHTKLTYDYKREDDLSIKKLLDMTADIEDQKTKQKEIIEHLDQRIGQLNEKIKYDELLQQMEESQKKINDEKERLNSSLQSVMSYNIDLTNIIRGINHEVSPWMGAVANCSVLSQYDLREYINMEPKSKDFIEPIIDNIEKINYACKQAESVLTLSSVSIKKLRNFSNTKGNLADTIKSWGHIALMEHDIKSKISPGNIQIDYDSLNFDCIHSPALVSQIILNLVKNAIDHNQHMLDSLVIKIYGKYDKRLYVEDNGKGIDKQRLTTIFKVGVSTKKESNKPSGLGLYNIVNYCQVMGSIIRLETKVNKFTRFHVEFKVNDTDVLIRQKNDDRISAYYQIISDPTKEQKPYVRTDSCESIEVIPTDNSSNRLKIADITKTLKALT